MRLSAHVRKVCVTLQKYLFTMELWALVILPLLLLALSLNIASFNRWREFPALGVLCAVNVVRGSLYVAGWYTLNPQMSRVCAALMLLAAEEAIRRAGLRPWPRVFCAGIGLMLAALAVQIGEAVDPLKSGLHVATAVMLAVAVFVSLLNRADHLAIVRECLMLVYVVGAIFSSKQPTPDMWWTILATEAVHVAALSGFLWLAVSGSARALPERAR